MNTPIRNNRNGSVVFGCLLVAAGLLFILKQFKVIEFDFEIWPLFLIAGGVINGMKKGFSRMAPLLMIVIGIAFMIPNFMIMGVSSSRLIWPLMLILVGLFIALRAKKKEHTFALEARPEHPSHFDDANSTHTRTENFVNIEAFFGGRKEIITSKQFSGCNATAICGGAEINLMQADNAVQPMIIDLRVVFGGIEVIVPSHWEVINEVDVLFGGIEDKRNLRTSDIGEAKKLLLRGSVTFGGLELKSY